MPICFRFMARCLAAKRKRASVLERNVNGGYIGTVGKGVTLEIILNYIEQQGTLEEKDGYKQINLLEFYRRDLI